MSCYFEYGKWPILLIEAQCGDLEGIRQCFANGDPINAQADTGWSAGHYAAREGYDACLLFLLENGFDVFLEDLRGNTPIHIAAMYDQVAILKMLVDHGVPVDFKSEKSFTALHVAAANGQLEAVRYLVEQGADVFSCTESGALPVKFALLAASDEKNKSLVTRAQQVIELLNAAMENKKLNNGISLDQKSNNLIF